METTKLSDIIIRISLLTDLDTTVIRAMVIEGFMNYIDWQCLGVEWSMQLMMENEMLYKWWINQWFLKDKEFIRDAGSDIKNNRANYYRLHDIKNLKAYPNNCIYDETYERYTREFIDQYKK